MSPRADFYLIRSERFRAQPLRVACVLAHKAWAAGSASLILARDAAQAEALDEALWTFSPASFLPHQIIGAAGGAPDAAVPVLIAAPGAATPPRDLVLNLREETPAGDFARVLEIVPAEKAARSGARQRWRTYQDRGFQVTKHDL